MAVLSVIKVANKAERQDQRVLAYSQQGIYSPYTLGNQGQVPTVHRPIEE